MASLGGEQQILSNSQAAESGQRNDSREGSAERKVIKDRDEKLKLARERQNEERQRKIEELKIQAEAAQRYREQKDEERRRRIEEIRQRDCEKRQQVEERKRAIMEAEKERREYILKKNQERDYRLDSKKRERSTAVYAFGSSTPRLLEPADFGTVSPSTFWGQRRSTSVANVAGATLSRRSSERELNDSGSKKRAVSASGDDHRRKSSSMYEVFNWGYSNDEPPKRYSLSIVGSEINIDEPPRAANASFRTSANTTTAHKQSSHHLSTTTATTTSNCFSNQDDVDSSRIVFRSVARRKTDLMPTITSPRDGHYSSRSSLSNTPRTPGRAYSMNRLDQLAQPIRRNGEHIRAIVERERREHMEMLDETESLGGGRRTGSRSKKSPGGAASNEPMSRSMTHLAGSKSKYSVGGGISSNFRPLSSKSKDNCSRSGNVTPGGSNYTSRPGSAMSTSTTMSTSGFVTKRTSPAVRKPRPASIAGTVLSFEEMNKAKRDKPPTKTSTPPSASALAQTTPKRTPNLMSTSLIVTSSSRLFSSEKKTPSKRESLANRGTSTPKSLSKTASAERLNKLPKEKPKDVASPMAKSTIAAPVASAIDTSAVTDQAEKIDTPEASVATPVRSTKEEKNALNAVKTDEGATNQTPTHPVTAEAVPEIVPPVEITEEKVDQGSEKEQPEPEPEIANIKSQLRNSSKENSEARELSPPSQSDNDIMTASMIARSKITTEEEAKAALAERRRLAREEAERQAELERQRLEAERLAEIKRQEEEAERQRQFEEESTRLAELQRKAEEERLRQAIEEAKQREEEERLKREEEERQRLEREEAEKRAKEEAEKQRIEVNERLKREEKEREERRKRVEAIMSRTRKAGAAITPNSTPVKENNDPAKNQTNHTENSAQQSENAGSDSSSTSGSVTTATTPSPNPSQTSVASVEQPQNTQELYEQAVKEKETELLKSFSNMIIDENEKNRQQQITEITNGKLHSDNILQNSTTVANGNGHIENINNKNEINIRQDTVAPSANQLIDLSIESQDINNAVNLNNNNSLLSTTTLVTADSHENKDLSLL